MFQSGLMCVLVANDVIGRFDMRDGPQYYQPSSFTTS